ncbi:MAG TPA: ABC transporter ATP-binding protein [Virgibacillus sp.]|nr:ABC transporter ATP-binding protein [Virgibacillus sp.]
MMSVQVKDVDVVIDRHKILKDIQFSVEQGSFLGLIGPNGSGKSTLLKSIATLLPIETGNIAIAGLDQDAYTQKDLAKQISYVPQETVIGFDFTARDVVAMGRHVHSSFFQGETEVDIQKIEWAMEQTQTSHLADQSVLSLSTGQRQLIIIAKALAQDTPIILLDEPISALDIYYQLHILSLLKRLCDQGKTIIVVLHDLNLASRFCDQLLLLSEGMVQKHGHPEEVLTTQLLKKIYHVQATIRTDHLLDSVTITPFL